MARRNVSELAAGAVVLLVAGGFLIYAVANTGRAQSGGDVLHATFDAIDGLSTGSDVRLAGVKVGAVTATAIDDKTFQAKVAFSVPASIHLPTDSSAQVTSDGLLGGMYLSLTPGGANDAIPNGGTVAITQSTVSLEQLLGKFIFSVTDLAANVQKQLKQGAPGSNGAAPAAPDAGAPLGKLPDAAPAPLK